MFLECLSWQTLTLLKRAATQERLFLRGAFALLANAAAVVFPRPLGEPIPAEAFAVDLVIT